MVPSRLKSRPVRRRRASLLSRIGTGIQKASFAAFVTVVFLISAALVSLAFVSAYQYLLTSSYFRLKNLVITGTGPEIERELIQMGGLDVEISTIDLDMKDIKQRMEIHPWVRSVSLKRQFPRSLHIEVERRTPIALVPGNIISFLDETGEVFKELKPGDNVEYPILTGLSEDHPIRKNQISMAVGLLKALKSEEGSLSFDKVAEINMKANGLMTLYLTDLKAEIRCAGSDFAAKLPELKRILGHLKETGRADQVAGIDLNYEDGVAVSFKKG